MRLVNNQNHLTMKIKHLSVVIALFWATFTVTSCLDSNNTEIVYSSDDTIQAFELDTIYGVNYKFTIDQRGRQIYNLDSVPFSADTIINKILVTTLSSAGYITTGDTAFVMSDSVDLSNTMVKLGGTPMKLKVQSMDGAHSRTYSLEVRIHQQIPDTLEWSNPVESFSNGEAIGSQKTIILNNKLFTFISHKAAYSSALPFGNSWSKEAEITGLPESTVLNSIQIFKNSLYVLSGEGDIYKSQDGISWSKEEALSGNVKSLLFSFPDYIAGVVEEGGVSKFAVTNEDLNGWITTVEAPASFPTENISATSFKGNTNATKYMLMGKSSNKTPGRTAVWYTLDGKDWADLTAHSYYYCPEWDHPTIMYYDDKIYAFGEDFTFYTTVTGIKWEEVEKMVTFPEEFNEREEYSTVIDNDNFIWMIWSKNAPEYTDEVWRGRINRLGFDRQ